MPLGVTGDGATAAPFLSHDIKEPGTADPLVVLGRGDEQYVLLSTGSTRSLAAALLRLADVLEGLASAERSLQRANDISVSSTVRVQGPR